MEISFICCSLVFYYTLRAQESWITTISKLLMWKCSQIRCGLAESRKQQRGELYSAGAAVQQMSVCRELQDGTGLSNY
jgi:hypothetical protein